MAKHGRMAIEIGMGQVSQTLSSPLALEEKRRALERVLASRSLSRSDQLRAFLRYICEAEFEGRAHTLNEYELGVSVLGRPEDYSPAEDSCVRSRAYELRHKLEVYYRLEAPQDPIRIEIRKGAYAPQFRQQFATTEPETHAEEEPPAPSPRTATELAEPGRPPVKSRRVTRRAVWWVAALPLVLAGVFLLYQAQRSASPASGLSPEMTEFWNPFLDPKEPLVICYESRLFLFSPQTGLVVRDYLTNRVAEAPASAPLTAFRNRMKARELIENNDYADVGAVHAAFLLGRLLGPRHEGIGLKPSTTLSWHDMWSSNVIFIGKPNLDPSIRYVLRNDDFLDTTDHLVNIHPRPGEQAEYRHAATHGEGEKYALITLAPGPQAGRHIMVLSGAGSELMWALAEAVTDQSHVREIVSRLRQPPGELPQAFQVVIQATFQGGVPLKVR